MALPVSGEQDIIDVVAIWLVRFCQMAARVSGDLIMPSTKEASEHASADINAFREKIRTGKRGSDHLYIMLLGMKMLETDELLRQVQKVCRSEW
jgi:hypothetical protein